MCFNLTLAAAAEAAAPPAATTVATADDEQTEFLKWYCFACGTNALACQCKDKTFEWVCIYSEGGEEGRGAHPDSRQTCYPIVSLKKKKGLLYISEQSPCSVL